MTARARKPSTKLPMADMSPGKFEERVRTYGQALYDHTKVQDRARESAIGFVFDFARSMCGFPHPTVKE